MQNVKVFLNKKHIQGWVLMRDALENEGIPIYTKPSDADVSIVLSGQHINPMILTGEKVLLAYAPEWGPQFKYVFYPVLKEYYDKIHIVTGKTVEQIIDIIKSYETHKP